ncbi:MAG TPA: hypothetical protein VEV87_03015 [Chitinophagaceae bacterium]|nr:hypothetical protein [Chitinophagaceae bacterium]
MSQKLELIREEKLFRLLPGRKKSSRLEASGVALLDDTTAFVIFDNLNWVARIDLALKRENNNRLFPAPSLGSGFEDIAIDMKMRHFFCLIEELEDFDGKIRGFVSEYESDGTFVRCAQLPTQFKDANKGFEGLTHIWQEDREYLYALCEGNLGTAARKGGGRIDVFIRASNGSWENSHRIKLPKDAEFKDYSALAYHDGRLAIVSQESSRLWVARIDEAARDIVPGSSARYRFPNKSYRNIEGLAWLADDTIVAVSDRKKTGHPARCAEKDQSIHIFRIPEKTS